jgi:hypothetical protein
MLESFPAAKMSVGAAASNILVVVKRCPLVLNISGAIPEN